MRKREKEDIGYLLTREILVMLKDANLSKEQRLDVLNSVLFDDELEGLLGAMSRMLKAGFDKVNGERTGWIERERKRKRDAEQNRRNGMARNGAEWRGMARNGGLNYNIINNTPYSPPKGDKRENTEILAKETEMDKADGAAVAEAAEEMDAAVERLAESVEGTEAYGHMRVGRRTLERCLMRVVEKKAGRPGESVAGWRIEVAKLGEAIVRGLEAWTPGWSAQGWRYAPGKVTRWLNEEKWLEEPRAVEEVAPSEASRFGDVGVDEIV